MDEPRSGWTVGHAAPALAGMVDRYVAYELTGYPAGLHWGLPSGRPTFIVSSGPPIDVVAQADADQAPARYGAVLSGLQATSARIAHDGNQQGVAVELTPVGFHALFGLAAGELWSTSVELDDVIGPAGGELVERVQLASTSAERFAACDDVLTRVAHAAEVAAELRQAWQLVVGSAGAATVASVAESVGWSRQHLAKRFAAEFGLAPKLAGRVVRFGRAARLAQTVPSFVTIAQVAAVCGYYDQAHLDRDFVEFTGVPPSRLIAEEELPSVQDDAVYDLAR